MTNEITKKCLDCGKSFSYNDRDFDFPAPKPKLCRHCFDIEMKNMRFKRCLEEVDEGIRDSDLVTTNKKELECLAKAILRQIK